MTISIKYFSVICCVAWSCFFPVASFARDAQQAILQSPESDMDMSIKYFKRENTVDGVLHESSYEEKMIRRKGHVWTQRVLPSGTKNRLLNPNHGHKDFNHVLLPRHVKYDGSKISVEYIDTHERQIIYIAPAEYENVNFDGSWPNTYYLINPQYIALMPVSTRQSAVPHAQWHEVSKNGMLQRVLWDKMMNIPLIIETGDKAGNFLQRVEIRPSAQLVKNPPWNNLIGYAQKEYSDFLD